MPDPKPPESVFYIFDRHGILCAPPCHQRGSVEIKVDQLPMREGPYTIKEYVLDAELVTLRTDAEKWRAQVKMGACIAQNTETGELYICRYAPESLFPERKAPDHDDA